jgi:tripartite-type tricarboxylate transporter receptor subunit TctC
MKLHDAVVKTVETPAVRKSLMSVGADPRTMTPDEFTSFIRDDIKKWAELVKSSGIKVER